jgi:pimeloyl-ACP methyl ester carboxylesterase
MEQRVSAHGAPVESQFTLGELEMHYLDWGGEGMPVLALHGAASSSHWYDLVIPHIRDRCRFIAPDQRAHGKSGQPAKGYDWATLAADAIGLLDRLEIPRAAVIGHSWGGGVALSLALLHPDRVSALALVEGGFSSGPRSPGMTWEGFKERAGQRDIYGPKERYLGALRKHLDHCWSDELERILLTMVRHDPDGTVWETLTPQTHEQMLWAMWSDSPSRNLAQVRCPTLFVAADQRRPGNEEWQRSRRERVEAAQAVLPSAQVVWVPDTGHDIGFEKPRELAEALGTFFASIE